jgi:hypothetical protein
MNEERIQLVADLWDNILGNQVWNRDSANLRRYVKRVNHEDLTLKEIHRLLSEILSNQFLRKGMSKVFQKHENQLRSAVLHLENILGRRKEAAGAMRKFYLEQHQVSCGEKETVDCEIGASEVKEIVEQAIDQYSYEMFSKEFDISTLSPALDEIEATLKSPAFIADCLRISVADFVAEAESASAGEITLRQAIAELMGLLIESGYDPRDLSSLSKSMAFADGRRAEERFKSVISSLTANPRSYVVLTTIDDVKFAGDESHRIGLVTFHGEKSDYSRFIGKIPQELSFTAQLSGKVVVESPAQAFGTEQAKGLAHREIAKAIDLLSLEDPAMSIREPNEERHSRQIVLDERMMPADISATNRLELYGKVLDSSTRSNTDKILTILDAVLKKPSNQLTDFERRILAGMHFYRKGNAAFDSRDKVVNYIVSLESMIVMSGEHPSSTLPKRVLDVMGVSKDYRSEVRRLVEDAYHHRGEILHLGLADEQESDHFSREISALDRRLLDIMFRYVGKSKCETLEQFIELLENETVAERERMLKTAILDINKEYMGKGVLKHSDGSEIGDVSFTFSYKDDGRYVYMLGSITSFKLKGSVTHDTGCYIVGTLDGIAGVFRVDMAVVFNPFSLIGLALEKRVTLPFKAKVISRI